MQRCAVSKFLLTLSFLATSASMVFAQAGMVRGKVVDAEGAPIAGAILIVDHTQVRTQSSASGTYRLVGIPAGAATILVRLIGYTPATINVTIRAGETVAQDVTLKRSMTQLASMVVTGSRAQHQAAEELAVPVDVVSSETIQKQGTSELSSILQSVSPSVNFPRQSITDADDIVRPFTMRGLSPDHTLVLVNGVRRHRTALVHTFAFGMPAGSTGVDLNALPTSAIDRMEVLRDGAAAQYGSDAIAGVVNLHIKSGDFEPFLNADAGRYFVDEFPNDGNTVNLNGGWGMKLGRGSLGLFAEYRNRQPTNRAWPEAADQIVEGDADEVDANGNITKKNNSVDQPNHHLGDGLANDLLAFVDLRLPLNDEGTRELYGFGGYAYRIGTGNGFFRQGISDRNWPTIYPKGFLPEFRPDVTDWSAAGGLRGKGNGWTYDASASIGRNVFNYQLRNTMNVSLGPCLTTACAPGVDGILGNSDDPGIPNSTHFNAGGLRGTEAGLTLDLSRQLETMLPNPVNFALGVGIRRESFELVAGEKGSWVQGGHLNRYGDPASPGSQVFSGFSPAAAAAASRSNASAYLELESDLTTSFLVNVAGRFENYSDFGSQLSSKVALRYQPGSQLVLRTAFSTGFRAPSLAQSYYGSRITNFRLDPATGKQAPFEVGIFPVSDPAAIALGAKPLTAETSVNLSAGVAWSPNEKLSLMLDGYSITLNDRILLTSFLGGDEVEAILKAKGVAATSGQYFTNIVDTRTNGIDFTGNYHTVLGTSGVLTVATGVNYTTNEIVGQRDNPSQLAGTGAELVDMFSRIQIERERPDWRGTVTVDYTRGRSSALVRASYYGQFNSAPGLCGTCEQTFGARTLFDAELGRQYGNVRWSLGVRNLLDTYPEKNSLDNGYGILPWAGASPFGYNGRFVYTKAQVVFGRK